MQITKTAQPIVVNPKHKKVAAYARVSKYTDRLENSLDNQVTSFNTKIHRNAEWDFAGIYIDNAVSGTSMDKRSGLNRMLTECEAGNIDIILCKSISRLARNTVDTLNITRHLKALGIDIWFEKEGIHTLSNEGELMLSLMAAFAQSESESISTNIKWGLKRKFSEGTMHYHKRILGYQYTEQKEYVVDQNEAKTVRWIYSEFLKGRTMLSIADELNDCDCKTVKGKPYRQDQIKRILTNVTYTGSILLQKYYNSDPLTQKHKRNLGERDQILVSDANPAIIDQATFDQVLEKLKKDALPENVEVFRGLIKCGICGGSLTHQVDSKTGRLHWICAKRLNGNKCTSKGIIYQEDLERETTKAIGMDAFNPIAVKKNVTQITMTGIRSLEFQMDDKRILTATWKLPKQTSIKKGRPLSREIPYGSANWSEFRNRIFCSSCGHVFWREKNSLGHIWRCNKHFGKCKSLPIQEEDLRNITKEVLELDAYDPITFIYKVDRIEVTEAMMLRFCLRDGTVVEKMYTLHPIGRKRRENAKNN